MGIKDDKPVIQTRQHRVGGDNIIQFPTKKIEAKETKEKDQLLHLQKLLRYHYKLIKEAYENLAKLQQGCGKAEDDYDELLYEYSERVGLENVEKKYLDYGSKVKPVLDEYGISLVIED